MTVAIAAIGDRGNAIVMASDRMVVFPDLQFIGVDGVASKIFPFGKRCAFIGSGKGAHCHEVWNDVKQCEDVSIKNLAGVIVESYKRLRVEETDNSLLVYGYNLLKFETSGRQQLTDGALNSLLSIVHDIDLNFSVLLAGFDDDKAKIGIVEHPGKLSWRHDSPYGTTGAGGPLAAMCMEKLPHNQDADLASTMYAVFAAKKFSESNLAVGKSTDMMVLTAAGHRIVDEGVIDAFDVEYNRLRDMRPDLSAVHSWLNR